MPDDDVVIGEVGADPIDTLLNNPIADFLKSVEDQNFVGAENQFNDMVTDRLQDAMDQAKIKIATNLYGEEEVEAAQQEVDAEEEEDFPDSEPEEEV
jgi:hypothetical protein